MKAFEGMDVGNGASNGVGGLLGLQLDMMHAWKGRNSNDVMA